MAYDTDTMVYLIEDANGVAKHKYYVTSLGVKNRLNIDLKTELGDNQSSGITEEKVFIQQVSDRVYRWLYGYIRRNCIKQTEYQIANNFVGTDYGIPYREAMEEALYAQVEYMINFDGDLEAQADGDINKLVSVESKAILKGAGIAHKMTMFRLQDGLWRVDY